MTITATQKFTRQTGRKVRLVANQIKKLPLEQALRQLAVIERRSTLVLMKTVKQAVANAINNHGLKFEDLKLDNIIVNDGPQYKRMRAVSRGRGHEIKKRTSHIVVTLSTVEATKAATKPVAATPAEAKPEATTTDVTTEKTETKSTAKTKPTKKVTK